MNFVRSVLSKNFSAGVVALLANEISIDSNALSVEFMDVFTDAKHFINSFEVSIYVTSPKEPLSK